MKNLLNWEFSQTFKSKSFIITLIIMTLAVFLFMLMAIGDGAESGFELFFVNCNNINSLFQMIISIFAAIHVTGAFESRRIQAAVMAGNSRMKILAVKLISFSAAIAVFYLVPMILCSAVGLGMYGIGESDGSFFASVIIRSIVHMLSLISFMSVGFAVSVYVKNIGAAVGANIGVLVVLSGIAEYFLTNEKTYDFIKFTSVGQTMLVLADGSTSNLAAAIAVSLFGIIFSAALAYLKFGREELK